MMECFSFFITFFGLGFATLNRLLKDATVLAPGQKSVTFMTPFNSDWCWSNRTHNIKANEVWAETNVMSELTIPVSLDKMVDCMITEMNKDVMRYNSPSGDHAFEYQKSLRNSYYFFTFSQLHSQVHT